jgi:hypothetical protein
MLLAKKKDNDSSTLTAEIIDVNERDNYLLILNDTINKLHHKATNGKIRNPKNEKIKIDYYRALIYAINTANTVYKDKQIDKLESDFEKLKKGLSIKDKADENSGEISDGLSDVELNELIDFDEKIKKLSEKGD